MSPTTSSMPNSHLTAAVQGVAASKSGSKPGASTASDHGYLVSAQDFHDACGTGFIAETTGTRSRRVVEMAIQAVDALTHRGAVNADPLTGDGSGITIQIPFELLQDTLQELGADVAAEDLAVGMIFLPHEESNRPRAREIFEEECRRAGVEVIGWRVVPTDASVLGPQALESLPGFEQLLLRRPADQQGRSSTVRSTSRVAARSTAWASRNCGTATSSRCPPRPSSTRA